MTNHFRLQPGVGAALLFGAGTPLAKLLLAGTDPWLLAGLLYLGSGLGLTRWRLLRRSEHRARLARGGWPWLAGAALLLNAEGVFTTVIAFEVVRSFVAGLQRVLKGMQP